jgi:hypothetical protein
MSDVIYARVADGKIIEYPVFGYLIKNRAHPQSWYTQAKLSQKPPITNYEYLREVPTIVGSDVIVNYVVEKMSLDFYFNSFYPKVARGAAFDTPIVIEPIFVHEETNKELIGKFTEELNDHYQKALDSLAQEKGYGGVMSCSTYISSSNAKFKAEAQFMIDLRDTVWASLYKYLGEVLSATKPIPKNLSEINAVLPAFEWPVEPATPPVDTTTPPVDTTTPPVDTTTPPVDTTTPPVEPATP